MTKWAIEIAGWVGALLILGSYGLLTTRRVRSDSLTNHCMNLLGAVGLTINGVGNGAFPSACLNIIWFGIASYGLARLHKA